MGKTHSKITAGGSLPSATPKNMSAESFSMISASTHKTFRAVVPKKRSDRKGGKMIVTIMGERTSVAIPQGLKPGESFEFQREVPNIDQVMASTLPTLPGMEVVVAKPIVWGTVSIAFVDYEPQSAAKQVGYLMQQAQIEILKQTASSGCNACLSMTFNITNDSQADGRVKAVVVTAHGTPCIVESKQ